jgi:tubulin polyglutamylase complex subunit 2
VCLVYLDKSECESDLKREDPKIWLLDRSFEWHFLAEDFTKYFRMMLVHQGLPQWQFKFTPMGLTPWAEVSFMLRNYLLAVPILCGHVTPKHLEMNKSFCG